MNTHHPVLYRVCVFQGLCELAQACGQQCLCCFLTVVSVCTFSTACMPSQSLRGGWMITEHFTLALILMGDSEFVCRLSLSSQQAQTKFT